MASTSLVTSLACSSSSSSSRSVALRRSFPRFSKNQCRLPLGRPLRSSSLLVRCSLQQEQDQEKGSAIAVAPDHEQKDEAKATSHRAGGGDGDHQGGQEGGGGGDHEDGEKKMISKEEQQEVDWRSDEEFKKFMGNPSIEAAIKLEKKRADRKLRELDREPDASPVAGLLRGLVRDTLAREKQRLEQAEQTFKALDLNKVAEELLRVRHVLRGGRAEVRRRWDLHRQPEEAHRGGEAEAGEENRRGCGDGGHPVVHGGEDRRHHKAGLHGPAESRDRPAAGDQQAEHAVGLPERRGAGCHDVRDDSAHERLLPQARRDLRRLRLRRPPALRRFPLHPRRLRDRDEADGGEVRREAEPVVPRAVQLDGVPRRDEQLRVAAAEQEGPVRHPRRAHGQRVPDVAGARRLGVHRRRQLQRRRERPVHTPGVLLQQPAAVVRAAGDRAVRRRAGQRAAERGGGRGRAGGPAGVRGAAGDGCDVAEPAAVRAAGGRPDRAGALRAGHRGAAVVRHVAAAGRGRRQRQRAVPGVGALRHLHPRRGGDPGAGRDHAARQRALRVGLRARRRLPPHALPQRRRHLLQLLPRGALLQRRRHLDLHHRSVDV